MDANEIMERMVLAEVEKSINELSPDVSENVMECVHRLKLVLGNYDIEVSVYAAALVESQCRLALYGSS